MIELECKWLALHAVQDLELDKAKAEAQEIEAEAEAKAQVAKAQEAAIEAEAKAWAKAQEAAIEAETKARFSIEEAKLKAELKLLELSKCGSSVASKSALRKVHSIKGSNKGSVINAVPHISFSMNHNSLEFYDGGVTALDVRPKVLIPFSSENWKYQETKPHSTFEQDQSETKQRPKCKNKHSVVLYEFYSRSTLINLGAAKTVSTKRSYEVEDELIQLLHNDQITCLLVEPNIEVIDNCYEILVSMKKDVINVLPCNFYFFITKQKEPRVVFNSAISYKGFSLNNVVYPGINLLSGLVEILTRFRLEKYACMADLSKCFFQIFCLRTSVTYFA